MDLLLSIHNDSIVAGRADLVTATANGTEEEEIKSVRLLQDTQHTKAAASLPNPAS